MPSPECYQKPATPHWRHVLCLGTNCLTSLVLSSEESSTFILLILPAPSVSPRHTREESPSRESSRSMNLPHFLLAQATSQSHQESEQLLGPPVLCLPRCSNDTVQICTELIMSKRRECPRCLHVPGSFHLSALVHLSVFEKGSP